MVNNVREFTDKGPVMVTELKKVAGAENDTEDLKVTPEENVADPDVVKDELNVTADWNTAADENIDKPVTCHRTRTINLITVSCPIIRCIGTQTYGVPTVNRHLYTQRIHAVAKCGADISQ